MTRQERKHCFANMFPVARGVESRASGAGKTLSRESIPSGGLAAPDRRITVNMNEWEDCRSCGEFDSCYRLSMAKLSLAGALQLH